MIKVKKIIGIIGIVLLLSSMMVLASEMEETGEDYTGNPYLIDHARGGLFTVVDNHVCSVEPSWSKTGVVTASAICWRNEDGGSPGGVGSEHPAVIYSLWTNYESTGREVGSVTIMSGERKCLAIPEQGKDYYRQAFYCDEEQIKCEETYSFYSVGCDYDKCSEGQVLRKRGLNALVSGGCNGWETEACISDDGSGFDCVQSGTSGSASSGQDGSGTTPDGSILRGEWNNIGMPEVVKPGAEYEIRATFKALNDGTYYLEAGMLDRAFSLSATGSKCDDSIEFAGGFYNLKTDESIDITFNLIAKEEEGTYNVIVGAYTGCLNNNGDKVNTITDHIKVSSEEDSSSSSSNAPGILAGVTIGSVLIILGIIVVLMGIGFTAWYLMKK